jgi:MFS family permease
MPAEPIARSVDPDVALRATVGLIAMRIGYAYNWYDVGPALPSIGSAFGVGPAQYGLLVAAFLVGGGLLQVPAGLLSRKLGPRTVSFWGVGLLSVAAAACALAPSFGALLALRTAAGVGAALFFSPAIGLVGSLFPPGRRGIPVGVFSSAFSVGAALGLVGPAFLIPLLGWRLSLVVGGLFLGVPGLVSLLLVPRSVGRPLPSTSGTRPRIPAALRFRGTWAVGIAFVGLEGATFATGQFLVPWGESVQGWTLGLAGAVGMMFVLPSILGGPLGGRVAEEHRNHRTQFVVATFVSAAMVALLPWANLASALAIGTVFSVAYGVDYAVMYVIPQYWKEVPNEEIPLAIGLLNSVQLAGGAGVSALFGSIVQATSYSVAWEWLAVLIVVPLGALVLLPAVASGPDGRPGGADPARP